MDALALGGEVGEPKHMRALRFELVIDVVQRARCCLVVDPDRLPRITPNEVEAPLHDGLQPALGQGK
jgi:hypothetical protein